MGCVYGVARLYGFRQPYVTAYNAVVANYSISAEYSRTGVDDHIVAYIGVALYALYRGAVHVGGEALCAEGNALIQLHMVANGSGFAYYHACAVVYEKYLPMVAPGCISIPVLRWAISVMRRGSMGTFILYSSWAMRYMLIASKPG